MEYDLIIQNGRIVDGTGSSWFKADVGITGEKIVKVGKVDSKKSAKLIELKSQVVSPGFIDVHTHTEFEILVYPQAESFVQQGITSVIAGTCGHSAAPMKKENINLTNARVLPHWGITPDWTTLEGYFKELEKQGSAINLGSHVGLGTCMIEAMGSEAWDRCPTKDEVDEMKKMVDQAMRDGAFGLSSGLEYDPQCFISTDVIIELSKVAAKYYGIYATHVRERTLHVIKATKEAIEIGLEANIPVQCSHIAARILNGERTKQIIELVEESRKKGLDFQFDDTLYSAPDEYGNLWCSTSISRALFGGSKYTFKGGKITLDMLRDPFIVESLRKDLINRQFSHIFYQRKGLDNWDTFVLVHCKKSPEYIGKNFFEIGKMMNKDPFDAAIDLLIAEGEDFPKMYGKFIISSTWNANFALLHPLCSIITDGRLTAKYGKLSFKNSGPPANRPRAYGLYPLLFEKWVREHEMLTLEDAVRKCTGLPAQQMRIMDRGILRPGMFADIVIFDPDTIRSKSSFEDPCHYPEGINYVIVNGQIVVENGEHSRALPGKILRLNK
jgi:N-acyl-D-aspartate/D-glutamate deacylase